jgi:hypothetical protein
MESCRVSKGGSRESGVAPGKEKGKGKAKWKAKGKGK